MEEGEPIEHNLISRAIENAQAKVEARNFDMRKHLLEYDDVMNQQREVIYEQRREALRGEDLRASIEDMILERADEIAAGFIDEKVPPEDWDLKALNEAVFKQFNFRMDLDEAALEGKDAGGVAALISDRALETYAGREAAVGPDQFKMLERYVMLQTVDSLWKDHLLSMDHLKEGIGLRGYAQQNPLIVYKKEGFEMFNSMIHRVKEEIVEILFKIQVAKSEDLKEFTEPEEKNLVFSGGDGDGSHKKTPVKRERKVGRNDPCPCGSGKKYKKCCGT